MLNKISNFEINGNVNLNTSGTIFDTLVVRRPTNTTGLTDDYVIDLNELHIWVYDANILVENASSLVSSVVSWSNKDIELGSQSIFVVHLNQSHNRPLDQLCYLVVLQLLCQN